MIIIRIIMGFILLWLALTVMGWLARWWIVRKLNNLTQDKTNPITDNQPLVPCAHCGTYIVPDNAIKKLGKYYCCEEHKAE